MAVKNQEANRDLLIGRETRLLGQLSMHKLQFIVSYTEQLKDDTFFTQEQLKKQQQEWEDSLPTYTPSEEENMAVAESMEAIKKGEVTKSVDPRDRKALKNALGF